MNYKMSAGHGFQSCRQTREFHEGRTGYHRQVYENLPDVYSISFHWLGEILAQPGYCFTDSVYTRFRKADLGHPDTDGAAKQTDQNLIDHQWGEPFGVTGLSHQFHQPCCGPDDAHVDLTDVHGAALGNTRQTVRKHLQDQLGNMESSFRRRAVSAETGQGSCRNLLFLGCTEKRSLPRRITPDFHNGQIVVHRRIAAPRIYTFQKTFCPGRTVSHFEIVS
jgi:hypothetical protein